jgi:MFS family permease
VTDTARTSGAERALSADERRTVALLGIPTFALALAVTVVTTYLPVVAREFVGSTIVIGVIVGLEGIVALWLPLVAGTWSDRLRTPIGGRLPFVLAATPVVAAALVGMAFIGSTLVLAGAAFAFFVGYFTAYEPYRALYPDAVGEEVAGRAQSAQALWRGLGTGVALLGGGLLLSVWTGTPFIAAAGLFVLSIAVFVVVLWQRGVPDQPRPEEGGVREVARNLWHLVRDKAALRAFLFANGLWELSLAALKTFVVLYVTAGLGFSRAIAALVIGGVAGIVVIAALAAGKLADRYGALRVLAIALPVHGLGFLVPLLITTPVVVALAVPFIAIGGGVIMALPYAVLMPLMPEGEHGAVTGFYSFSRGLGTWLGPLLAGIAITSLDGVFSSTKGYQAVWGVCAAAILLSLLPLRRLRGAAARSTG